MSVNLRAFLEGADEILPLTEAQPIEQDEEKVEEAEEATSQIEEETASEEVQEDTKDEEVSAEMFEDEDLDIASDEFLVRLRFIPRMSYGDGTHSSTPATCPGCSDAADAAIIDAEISQDEESDEPGSKEYDEKREEAVVEGGGEDDMGFDTGDDLGGGLGEEAGAADTTGTDENESTEDLPQLKAYIGGQERFGEDVALVAEVATDVFKKVFNVGSKVWRRIRDRRMKATKNLAYIQRFWEKKLSRILNRVDTRELEKQVALAFPAEDWIQAAKVMIFASNFVLDAKKYVMSNETDVETTNLAKLKDLMDNVGINLDFENNNADLSDFEDKHARDSVVSLGYTPRNIESIVGYIGKIGKLLDKELLIKLKKQDEQMLDALKATSEKEPDSKIVKSQMVRMDCVLLVESTVYRVVDLLITDVLHVLSNFEDAVNAYKKDDNLSDEAKELRRSNKILKEYADSNPHDKSRYYL